MFFPRTFHEPIPVPPKVHRPLRGLLHQAGGVLQRVSGAEPRRRAAAEPHGAQGHGL